MHMIIDELLTEQQLNSPKRYIYEICEMYGWEFPESISEVPEGYRLKYSEKSWAKARKRRRLINDACIRLKINPIENSIEPCEVFDITTDVEENYYVNAVIPRYENR